MKLLFNALAPLALLFLLTVSSDAVTAQDAPLTVTIEVGAITPPTECDERYWAASYERKTLVTGRYVINDSTRYIVQYVNGDLTLVDYWGTGYGAYVQDYFIATEDDPNAGIGGYYDVPLWSNTYHAVTSEYAVIGDRVFWEVRAEIECQDGAVIDFQLTSQAVEGTRESLPQPGENLVLALEDIPRYSSPNTQTGYLGTIEACQTFYISRISHQRASISTWAVDSITKQPLALFDGTNRVQLLDVAENYGQPGGQPILDQCSGA